MPPTDGLTDGLPATFEQPKSPKRSAKRERGLGEEILEEKMNRKRGKFFLDNCGSVLATMRAETNPAPSLVRQLLASSSVKSRKTEKYSPELKDFCAQLYKISPKAYMHCRRHLPFPGTRTVSQFIRLEELSRPLGWLPPKRTRVFFTPEQTVFMRAAYATNTHPNREDWKRLAEHCGCDWKKIRKWFEKQREVQKRTAQSLAKGSPRRESESKAESVEELQPNEKEKLPRFVLTATQVTKLEALFSKNEYLKSAEYGRVVRDIGCDLKKIKKWFENKRRKIRRGS